ncbi:MAG: nucleotide exchange factor GrpE [Parcubacteria group bacterium]|nr:nucleotide exchange factor GrpE [Parcubacteria group bacterium]MBI3075109.1 nucleotide exchange factor GrpE [Parcubacteria group bacterium]
MAHKDAPIQEEKPSVAPDEEVTIVPDKDVINTIDDEDNGREETALIKLKKKLIACEKERQEYLDGWQRAKADFVNARREEDESRKKLFSLAKEDVLLSFLQAADSFEMAFRDKESWEKVPEVWRKGVEYIYAQFSKVFQENGMREFGREGDVFDPTLHESVESVPTADEAENGKILEVLQKGYELNGKVVRPARVKVGEFREEK